MTKRSLELMTQKNTFDLSRRAKRREGAKGKLFLTTKTHVLPSHVKTYPTL
jgi:hypothetical protein